VDSVSWQTPVNDQLAYDNALGVIPHLCPHARFLVRGGLDGACIVWLADLQLARPGWGDRAGVWPPVAGDGSREHHGKQDDR